MRIIDGIDVSDAESIERLKREIGEQPLDVIINNAGIMGRDAFGSLDYGAILEQFAVNALGPLRVTEALADNLHEGSKVAIVTSRMGSIGDNGIGRQVRIPSLENRRRIRSAPISNTNSCRMASPSRCFIPVWLRPN